MRIEFFWGPEKDKSLWAYRWSLRGFSFVRDNMKVNVHYKSLLGLYGSNLQNRWINFKRDWLTILTLGR